MGDHPSFEVDAVVKNTDNIPGVKKRGPPIYAHGAKKKKNYSTNGVKLHSLIAFTGMYIVHCTLYRILLSE